MALDLSKTVAQLADLTHGMSGQRDAHAAALAAALAHLASADPDAVEERRRSGQITWLAAGLDGALAGPIPPAPLLPDHMVVAVDGSHIDVDRHSPAQCYLVNIGYVSLRYGELPDAALWNTPKLFASEDDLALRGPRNREQPVEGPILGMLRAVMEVEALGDLVEAAPAGMPVLALLDGSLILWGLTGSGYPDFVREALLDDRLLPALERLRRLGEGRTLAVASHVSLPRSTDVLAALRIAPEVCRWDAVNCDRNCGGLGRGERNCDVVAGVTDAQLFAEALRPGERSPLYRTTSSIVVSNYGPHQVRFFYVHLGEEIARIELPQWVGDEAVDLAHAALLTQAAKGHGYPLALQEAHEQAVISTGDRTHFAQLVEELLAAEGLPTTTSQKDRSKRTRFI
ncbi:MAG: DNA double-strand break repair nuclease NurA [Chloroflexi bacterium]|nr:DNA double-strand break repair nuclease NurA [Chloroflexota bacterium]